MKKLSILLLSMFFAANSHASAVTYTCLDLYLMAAGNDEAREARYNDNFNNPNSGIYLGGSPATANAGITVLAFIGSAFTGSLPVVLAATLAPSAISLIVNAPDKEEKALRLLDAAERSHKKFVKKLQKKVSAEITEQEVTALIERGFESGQFCSKLPKLMSAKKIKKYVTQTLEAKYQE